MQEIEAAHGALLHAIRQATVTSTQRQLFCVGMADLQLELRILEIEDKFFRSPFKLAGPWHPNQGHHSIFHGCHQGKYKDYLEGLFYDVGSVRLVAALLLAVKLTAGAVKAITDLPLEARRRLATFLEEDPLPQEIENWSRKFETNLNNPILLSDNKLPRLELTKFRSWNIKRDSRMLKKIKGQDSSPYSTSDPSFSDRNLLRHPLDSSGSPLLLVNPGRCSEDDRIEDYSRPALDHLRRSQQWIFEFLGILCALNPAHLHEAIFLRAFDNQQRWDARGERTSVVLSSLSLGIVAFEDVSRFQEALERIKTLGLITDKPGLIEINEGVYQCIASYPEITWYKIQAVRFISFVFPWVLEFEPQYGNLGRMLCPHLEYVLKHFYELEPKFRAHEGHELAGAFIASSRVIMGTEDNNWKHHALDRARNLLRQRICADNADDQYLRAWADLRQQLASGRVLSTNLAFSINLRLNALYGETILAAAYKLLRTGNISAVSTELDKFIPSENEYSQAVHHRIEHLKSKLLRYQKKFVLSLESTNRLLSKAQSELSTLRCALLAQKCELFCELNTPKVAKDMIESKLEELRNYNQQGFRKYRVLECSLADALSRGRSYCDAEIIYYRLRKFGDSFPKQTSNESYFRYHVGLAMVLHLDHRRDQALIHWNEVRQKILRWGWRKGFPEMVCLYALSEIYFTQGRCEEAESFLSDANELFLKTGREFWVTNLGTSFLDFLRDSIRFTGKFVAIDT